MKPEELLAHSDFVHALAKSLVFDEHYAADISQEAWLAALKRPPSAEKPMKAWLARVVRNFVINFRRDEMRRTRREQDATDQHRAPTSDEIAAREEIRSHVVDAVQNLHEPYRSTILLRFYENLTPREVAENQGLPLETVRTRLKRGIEMLRKRLDRAYDQNRKEWCLALAPLASLKFAAPTVGGSAAAMASTAAGSSALAVSLKLAAATLFLVGLVLTAWHLLPDGPDKDGAAPLLTGETDALPAEGARDRSDAGQGEKDLAREALDPRGIVLTGQVVEKASGEPVRSYDFMLCSYEHLCIDISESIAHETVRNEEGRFSIPIEEAGTYCAIVRSSRHRSELFPGIEVSREKGLTGLRFELDRGMAVTGRVIDRRTGEPIAGALVGSDLSVGPLPHLPEGGFGHWLGRGYEEFEIHTRTDAGGRFSLSGLEATEQKIAAIHPGYAQVWTECSPHRKQDLQIALEKGFTISGKAYTDRGVPASGLIVRMWGENYPLVRSTEIGPDGGFETESARPGKVIVWVSSPGNEIESDPAFTPEMKVVELVDRDVEVVFGGDSREFATWSGRVYDSDGAIVPGGSICLRPDASFPWEPVEYIYFFIDRYCEIDGDGRFEIPKLLPGRYEVRVSPSTESARPSEVGMVFSIARPGFVTEDIRFSTGSAISGTVLDGATGQPALLQNAFVLALRLSEDANNFNFNPVDDRGCFRIEGLSPGTYTVGVYASIPTENNPSSIVTQAGGVIVKADQDTDDLVVVIPERGRVVISLTGFESDDLRHQICSFSGPGESFTLAGSDVSFAKGKRRGTIDMSLDPGRWTLLFSLRSGGRMAVCERTVDIRTCETTAIDVERNDLIPFGSAISVQGRISIAGGVPLAGAELCFSTIHPPFEQPPGRELPGSFETKTDLSGRYSLGGLEPGSWEVSATTSAGQVISFGERLIRPLSGRPVVLDLVLPPCGVTGVLCNRRSGEPIGQDCAGWNVSLFEGELNMRLGVTLDWKPVSQQSSAGSRFSVTGLEPGNYRLLVDAKGFREFRIDSCTIEEGAATDLGEIQLDPCGLLELEVFLGNGDPADAFHLVCNSVEYCSTCYGSPIEEISPGVFVCDKLPLGSWKIALKKPGYEAAEIDIDLKPGRIVKARAVLIPR